MAQDEVIIRNLQKWSYIRTISKPEKYLACITGLRCAHARVILAVMLGAASTNVIC